MAAKPKLAWQTDQRELSLHVYAASDGRTRLRVEWRECQAGEVNKREWEVLRMEWPGAINTRQHAIWCLTQAARRLADQEENPVPNVG
jgi:hypothetical protein